MAVKPIVIKPILEEYGHSLDNLDDFLLLLQEYVLDELHKLEDEHGSDETYADVIQDARDVLVCIDRYRKLLDGKS